ncbi:MAG: cytochrome c3 family protein [Pseudomonadota bacterium]
MRRSRCGVISGALLTMGVVMLPMSAAAYISVGECSYCHTMHNSQGNKTMFNDPKEVTEESTGGPAGYCLQYSCAGCHTNASDGTTIVKTTAGVEVPIVYNTTVPTTGLLAGGNFYWVAKATAGRDDACGHNVWGISDKDDRFYQTDPDTGDMYYGAPGNDYPCGGSCHASLAYDPKDALWDGGTVKITDKNGCQGCHLYVSHHLPDQKGAGYLGKSDWNGSYRFLYGKPVSGLGGIKNKALAIWGYEDPKWEQNPSDANHNTYISAPGFYKQAEVGTGRKHNISSFCAGCHKLFLTDSGLSNGSFISNGKAPWQRHPADTVMPLYRKGSTTIYSEFAYYNNYTANPVVNPAMPNAEAEGAYNPLVPVGRTKAGFNINAVKAGDDAVMCISCHRAHGSPNKAMLRWPYDDTSQVPSGTCRVCHTQK